MKQTNSAVIQQKINVAIKSINNDHKTLFNYIEKLGNIVNQVENHPYAITILKSFISLFLEHVIKEEQLLQKYLPSKKTYAFTSKRTQIFR